MRPRVPSGPGSGETIQDAIVETITRLHAELDYWPSQVLVAKALDMPRRTLFYHVTRLVAAGRVEKLHGGRVLRIPPDGGPE